MRSRRRCHPPTAAIGRVAMFHRLVVAVLAALSLAACSDRITPVSPSLRPGAALADRVPLSTARLVRQLAASRGIVRLPRKPHVRRELVRLGQALAFDKILSGNRDISCMTCHLPAFATGDGKSLAVGQGGIGLGPGRERPDGAFIPRNAPPLFNMNAMMHLFWDGRMSFDEAGNFHTPAGAQLTPEMTRVFEFGAISALGLFPVTNRSEMRAALGDNEIANVPDSDLTGIWAALMHRLGTIPKYREMFEEAYPGTKFKDMTF